MKKQIIGALVGGLLIFIWQTLSHVAFNLHEPVQKYTANQDSVLSYLSSHIKEPGGYMLPRMRDNQSMDELEGFTKAMAGKPWARVILYQNYDTNMTDNMIRGLVVDIFIVFLFIWIVRKLRMPTKRTILLMAISIGLISFSNTVYTEHVWYPVFDVRAQLIDAVFGWAIVGVWLGYWMNRRA
jgi:hypothetical protein